MVKPERAKIIAVDLMGGDFAPHCTVYGLEQFCSTSDTDTHFLLFGDEKAESLLSSCTHLRARSTFFHAEDSLSSGAPATEVLRKSRDYSMRRAFNAVASGEAGTVISAGNTAGFMVAGTLTLGKIEGVARPALMACGSITAKNLTVLCDAGANISLSTRVLVQNAVMGVAFHQAVVGKKDPVDVGLVNVGSEKAKGHKEIGEALDVLSSGLPFINNATFVEPRDVWTQNHVVATDGFTGNILLKSTEGTLELWKKILKDELSSSWWKKIVGGLFQYATTDMRKRLNPERYNAAILGGLKDTAFKLHGNSTVNGVASGVAVAHQLIEMCLNETILEYLTQTPLE